MQTDMQHMNSLLLTMWPGALDTDADYIDKNTGQHHSPIKYTELATLSNHSKRGMVCGWCQLYFHTLYSLMQACSSQPMTGMHTASSLTVLVQILKWIQVPFGIKIDLGFNIKC